MTISGRSLVVLTSLLVVLAAGVLFVHKEKPLYQPSEENGSHETPQNGTSTASRNITVSSPETGSAVGLPIVVRGEARVFENTVVARLRDANGTVLGGTFGTARAADIGQFGPFELAFSYATSTTPTGVLEVYSESAMDGSEINMVVVPVRFSDVEAMNVNVFFADRTQDPDVMDCSRVFPVSRRVARTNAPARAALEELLRGPTLSEYAKGFRTNIAMGVELRGISITDGVATADFSSALDAGVGGSCWVTAIASQIRETLLQFPTITDVVIAVEGRTEDVLQP